MIETEKIEQLANEALTDEYFIVEIRVNKANVIEVTIDGDNGISIQKCVEVSRHIEHNLDRDAEDFELSVSSPGLGKPFKVYRQWVKNIGNRVEVTIAGNKPVSGVLKSVGPEGFDLEIKTLEKADGKKKKVEVNRTESFRFDQKPEVKNIISFK
ncbi:MAG: ribosome assembly cofactor RimP [Prolixibacteraceae bacterium]|nr:ribosome assembly cofactor RimP [Prolixibacteraceae bacterium]